MLEKGIDWIIGSLKSHIIFVILIFEVIRIVFIGKLRSLTKSGLEKRVQLSEIEKDDVGMNGGSTPPYPYIRIKQIIRNGSEVCLRISRVDIDLTVNKMQLEGIHRTDLPAAWIKTKSKTAVIPPNDLDYWITYATTKLKQVIPDFKEHLLKIEASGEIELQSRTTKIKRKVGGEITIEPREWT
jgi:hypothetical protein